MSDIIKCVCCNSNENAPYTLHGYPFCETCCNLGYYVSPEYKYLTTLNISERIGAYKEAIYAYVRRFRKEHCTHYITIGTFVCGITMRNGFDCWGCGAFNAKTPAEKEKKSTDCRKCVHWFTKNQICDQIPDIQEDNCLKFIARACENCANEKAQTCYGVIGHCFDYNLWQPHKEISCRHCGKFHSSGERTCDNCGSKCGIGICTKHSQWTSKIIKQEEKPVKKKEVCGNCVKWMQCPTGDSNYGKCSDPTGYVSNPRKDCTPMTTTCFTLRPMNAVKPIQDKFTDCITNHLFSACYVKNKECLEQPKCILCGERVCYLQSYHSNNEHLCKKCFDDGKGWEKVEKLKEKLELIQPKSCGICMHFHEDASFKTKGTDLEGYCDVKNRRIPVGKKWGNACTEGFVKKRQPSPRTCETCGHFHIVNDKDFPQRGGYCDAMAGKSKEGYFTIAKEHLINLCCVDADGINQYIPITSPVCARCGGSEQIVGEIDIAEGQPPHLVKICKICSSKLNTKQGPRSWYSIYQEETRASKVRHCDKDKQVELTQPCVRCGNASTHKEFAFEWNGEISESTHIPICYKCSEEFKAIKTNLYFQQLREKERAAGRIWYCDKSPKEQNKFMKDLCDEIMTPQMWTYECTEWGSTKECGDCSCRIEYPFKSGEPTTDEEKINLICHFDCDAKHTKKFIRIKEKEVKMKMKCPNCGKIDEAGQKYCEGCGSLLQDPQVAKETADLMKENELLLKEQVEYFEKWQGAEGIIKKNDETINALNEKNQALTEENAKLKHNGIPRHCHKCIDLKIGEWPCKYWQHDDTWMNPFHFHCAKPKHKPKKTTSINHLQRQIKTHIQQVKSKQHKIENEAKRIVRQIYRVWKIVPNNLSFGDFEYKDSTYFYWKGNYILKYDTDGLFLNSVEIKDFEKYEECKHLIEPALQKYLEEKLAEG